MPLHVPVDDGVVPVPGGGALLATGGPSRNRDGFAQADISNARTFPMTD
jgi:hypothetical protein